MQKVNIDLSKATKLETRIVARGEISNHAHIITGDAEIFELENERYIRVNSSAVIKHLLETEFVNNGVEVWTKEHTDIPLQKGVYKYVQQVEYDPYAKLIQQVRD